MRILPEKMEVQPSDIKLVIRTVKDLLRRTMGKGSLNLSELKNVLRSIAEVMNGRPVTYMSEDPLDLEPLTLALFIHPFGNVSCL